MPRANNDSRWFLYIAVAAAIGFVVLLAVFISQSLTLTGVGARLAVDQERIDLGRVKFEQPVRATFTVKNVGDQPLRLSETRIPAKLLEGC